MQSHRKQSILAHQLECGEIPRVNTNRMSDLRKILNPEEEEKQDIFKRIEESIINCECFELNLNNAAKIITIVVLFGTLIMIIKALAKAYS